MSITFVLILEMGNLCFHLYENFIVTKNDFRNPSVWFQVFSCGSPKIIRIRQWRHQINTYIDLPTRTLSLFLFHPRFIKFRLYFTLAIPSSCFLSPAQYQIPRLLLCSLIHRISWRLPTTKRDCHLVMKFDRRQVLVDLDANNPVLNSASTVASPRKQRTIGINFGPETLHVYTGHFNSSQTK